MFSENLNVVFPNMLMRVFRTCRQKEGHTAHVRCKVSYRAPEDTQRERGENTPDETEPLVAVFQAPRLRGRIPFDSTRRARVFVRRRVPGSGFSRRWARGVQDSVIEAFLGSGFVHRRIPGSGFVHRCVSGADFVHLVHSGFGFCPSARSGFGFWPSGADFHV